MNEKISVGIIGYGNLGRGVEIALEAAEDIDLVGVFTRRQPQDLVTVYPETQVYPLSQVLDFQDQIQVMILCGGSAKDLPEQTPHYSQYFNTVDSFDTHARIPDHYDRVDQAASQAGKVAIISVGWDPGLFSLYRVLGQAILPQGQPATFWGKGVSQGHSDAVRRLVGVQDAIQYTIPNQEAIQAAKQGKAGNLSNADKHLRECYVVLEEGADPNQIEQAIKTMPDYFADYETLVHFVSQEELDRDHQAMPHGGQVIQTGHTGAAGQDHLQAMSFQLDLASNPEFTASVLVAYARAAGRLAQTGVTGAKTIFDVPVAMISPENPRDLRRHYL